MLLAHTYITETQGSHTTVCGWWFRRHLRNWRYRENWTSIKNVEKIFRLLYWLFLNVRRSDYRLKCTTETLTRAAVVEHYMLRHGTPLKVHKDQNPQFQAIPRELFEWVFEWVSESVSEWASEWISEWTGFIRVSLWQFYSIIATGTRFIKLDGLI